MLSETDRAHLKTLAICWYVVCGLQAVFGLGGSVVYAAMGVVVMNAEHAQDPEAMKTLGMFMIIFGLVFAPISALLAFLSFLTAKGLGQFKRRPLIYVMASLVCLSVPIGTLLGVFTFIIMGRPAVKDAFAAQAAA